MPSYAQLIVWIVVGLLGGSLAGLIIKRDRQGFGTARNLALGLVGCSLSVACCSGCSTSFRALTSYPYQCATSYRRSPGSLIVLAVAVGLFAHANGLIMMS